jgi:hypothetical protein
MKTLNDLIQEEVELLDDLSLMIENEILYRYENLEKAVDSANTVKKELTTRLQASLRRISEQTIEAVTLDNCCDQAVNAQLDLIQSFTK